MTFRTRDFTPVPPHARPRRSRRAVRVIVTDGASVLVWVDTDPGLPGSRWYVTPGGGIDPGESSVDAAVRELWEETGLRVAASDLSGPVMRRVVVHGYSDQILDQSEEFYVLRTPRFTPDIAGHTPDEQLTLQGHVWLAFDDLEDADAPVWPEVLADVVALASQPDAWPWDLGVVEESSVPVGV